MCNGHPIGGRSPRTVICRARSIAQVRITLFMPVALCAALLVAEIARSAVSDNAYQAVTLHRANTPVVLLGAGDVDGVQPMHPDIIAVAEDGSILRMNVRQGMWDIQPLPISVEPIDVPGLIARPTISVGDVLPEASGDEVVVHSDKLVEVLVQTAPGRWENQIAADFSDIIGNSWGARVGEIDPSRPGVEIFHIFEGVFDFSSGHVTQPDGAGGWLTQEVYHAEVGMDAAIGDINAANPGQEIVVTTEMGPTYEITPLPGTPGYWPSRVLWDDFENAGWRVLIADVLPDQSGNEIVYGTRYTNRILLSREADATHDVEILFTGDAVEPDRRMVDVAVGNVDPSTPTLEIVGVDSTGSVYLVEYDGDEWSGRTIWQDVDGGLYAVVVANVLSQCAGDEVIVAGVSGTITLITRANAGAPDLNCDGAIGIADLLVLLGQWGECDGAGPCLADLNDDGLVNASDLLILLGSWGE